MSASEAPPEKSMMRPHAAIYILLWYKFRDHRLKFGLLSRKEDFKISKFGEIDISCHLGDQKVP